MLAKYSSNSLKNGGIVCDPAAGSGNLINEVIPELNLNPTQILVNDVNSKLLELLSMRIGLNYPKTISKRNSPQIYNRDIADMDKSIFNDVEVVVMNPPFCAGINSIPRRNKIYTKIKELTGNNPYIDVGQMPLEATFLEMVLALVKDGTTIACIFPKTHLIGRGPESQVIRRLLLNSFGLHTVFTYPGEDIFDDVTMDTCVLVGHVHTRSDKIKVISSYDRIPDIDTHHFYNSLSQSMTTSFSQITPGIVGKCVSFDELRDSIDDGWRTLNSEMVEAITFVEGKIKLNTKIKSLEDCEFPIKRGGAGNSGGSDLVFIDSRDDFKPLLGHLAINTASGMRNAVLDTIDIGRGDSEFFDVSLNDDNTVDETIRIYNGLPARNGRQQRNTKTNAEWKRILKRESNGRFSANSVLIPRGIRVTGKVYFSKNPVFVSTNFVVCSLPSYEDNTTQWTIYDPDATEYMVKLMTPQRDDIGKPDMAFGAFLGYTIKLDQLETDSQKYRVAVKEQLKRDIAKVQPYIVKKIQDNGLAGYSFYFYLLPFNDAPNERRSIIQELVSGGGI